MIDFRHIGAVNYSSPLKVPFHIVNARRAKLAELLQQHAYLPIQEVCRLMNVSEATARRDLAALAEKKQIVRTFGGALSEFNQQFVSFHDRLGINHESKKAIAKGAVKLIAPHTTLYFDGGSTLYAVAEELSESAITPLNIVTNNLSVAHRLASVDGIEVFLVGGNLLHRQSVILGELAKRSLDFYRIDLALMGAQAMGMDGLYNTQHDVVDFQKRVIQVATRRAFCIDKSKLNRMAPSHLVDWSGVGLLITDAAKEEILKVTSNPPQIISV